MGRKSREHRERRERKPWETQGGPAQLPAHDQEQADRCSGMEEELRRLADGNAAFRKPGTIPLDAWESHLKDVLAFESVGSGKSLFEGLEEHGVELPRPDKLDEDQSTEKVNEIMLALFPLQILLVGYEDMTAREFYSTLWNQILWEGCYLEKRNPDTVTIVDVSHRMSRSEILGILEKIERLGTVQ